MIQVRKAHERGFADHGWLKTSHTFSFGDYYDSQFMGFRALRVINEDYIAPGSGFPTHGHRDMEIVSYVAQGVLEHKDTLGNTAQIRPGVIQKMSAGTGIRHSEYNPSSSETTRLIQIWIEPNKRGVQPSYSEVNFESELRQTGLVLVAAPDAAKLKAMESDHTATHQLISLQQDARIWVYRSRTEGSADPWTAQGSRAKTVQTPEEANVERSLSFQIEPNRSAWIQMISGSVEVNGQILNTSDGAAVTDERQLNIRASAEAEFLIFDLA